MLSVNSVDLYALLTDGTYIYLLANLESLKITYNSYPAFNLINA